jgi:hypothetical protein
MGKISPMHLLARQETKGCFGMPFAPDKASRRNSLAAIRSRFGESKKSIVSPLESTAR